MTLAQLNASGIDFGVPSQRPVIAATGGMAMEMRDRCGGTGVAVSADDGLTWVYLHVVPGSAGSVEKGHYLGFVGEANQIGWPESGCWTPPHLRFQIFRGTAFASEGVFIDRIDIYARDQRVCCRPADGGAFPPGMPEHYDLHAWIWHANPNGVFAQWNPIVRCSGSPRSWAA